MVGVAAPGAGGAGVVGWGPRPRVLAGRTSSVGVAGPGGCGAGVVGWGCGPGACGARFAGWGAGLCPAVEAARGIMGVPSLSP